MPATTKDRLKIAERQLGATCETVERLTSLADDEGDATAAAALEQLREELTSVWMRWASDNGVRGGDDNDKENGQ